ncbi:MAG: hypothetical protein ABSH01_12305 [Terriglobia bacterium]
MTDSELQERMDEAIHLIREAIEERGGLLELEKKPDFRWAGVARLPAGKLMLSTHKTGKQAAPGDTKSVIEASADLSIEGRLIARILFHSTKTEVELPGGTHKPFGHAGIARAFEAL